MLAMVLALAVAAAIYVALFFLLVRQLAAAPLSWRILGWSGLPLALGGFGFASRFWHPTAGPYIANRIYPFGGHLQAWAVSFGFTWIAFGLLFTAAVVFVWQRPSRMSWMLLFWSWVLCWWPHAIIGLAFAWNGATRESAQIYGRWGSNPIGMMVLVSSAVELLWHFAFSIFGFIATGMAVFRGK